MGANRRQLHLNLVLNSSGAEAPLSLGHYKRLAERAEAAKLDALLFEERLAISPDFPDGSGTPETFTLLSGLAVVTSRIGLIASASAIYPSPYHIARKLATLDHISRGRAGWNIVAATTDAEDANYGKASYAQAGDRLSEAGEFVEIARKLWDSWEDDASIFDKVSGRQTRADSVRAIHHKGAWFAVEGPLNVPRPPQGYPVLALSPVDDAEIEFAARNAEIVVPAPRPLAEARDFAIRLRSLAESVGRAPDDLRILPEVAFTLAESEAARRFADYLEEAFAAGAIDGFQLRTDDPAESIDLLFEHVVPELQRRGLFREEYVEATLRERYGLARPAGPEFTSGVRIIEEGS